MKMIKELNVNVDKLTKEKIDNFKMILPQIEKLRIDGSEYQGDFYELILKSCSNLRHLHIYNIEFGVIIGKNNSWLHRQYPKLGHIEQNDSLKELNYPIPELIMFF